MVRVFFIVIIFMSTMFPQEFGVKAFTDTTEYMIGDYIKLNFVVTHDKDISFAEPSFRDSIQNIGIISINTPVKKEEKNKIVTTYEIILSRYDSSDITIDPVTFYYWHGKERDRVPFLTDKFAKTDTSIQSARSNTVSFRINAVKVNIQEDIKDIKGPVKLPPDWKIILLYILAVLILIAVLYYIYVKVKKKKTSQARKIPPLPPHVTALNSLKELDDKKLWQKGFIKDYHSEVTGIIRKYFEDRFKLPALELTTGETIELLKSKTDGNIIIADTEEFFRNADLVKFAKFVPMNEINEMMMNRARSIVEKTIPVNEPEKQEVSDVN